MALPADYITGTITLTNASNAFTGTGTGWQAADFREGDIILGIQDNAGVVYVVASITSNTAGTLTQPWAGPTGTYSYRMRYEWDSSRVSAQTRTLIELLGNGNLIAFSGLTGPGVPYFDGPHSMTIRPETDFVRGVAFDVQVANLPDRAAYDGQVSGFAVLVSDVGDGRAAVYSKQSNTSGDWSAPAYITGGVGPAPTVTVGTTTTLPPGSSATVTGTPTPGGTELSFGIPSGEGFDFIPGGYNPATAYVKGSVVRDNNSSWIALQPTTGNAPPTLPTVANAWWELLAAAGVNGAGTVASIVPGTGITVDNTDPTAPIISATGSGSGTVTSIGAGTGISVDSSNPAVPVVRTNIGIKFAEDFGADVAVANNATPLNSAFSTVKPAGNQLQFSSGVYNYATTLIASSSLQLEGNGMRNTTLNLDASLGTSATGFLVSMVAGQSQFYNGLRFRDFGISTSAASNAGIGLQVYLAAGAFLANFEFDSINIGEFTSWGMMLDNTVDNMDGFFVGSVWRCSITNGFYAPNVGDSFNFELNQCHAGEGAGGGNPSIYLEGVPGARQYVVRGNNFTCRGGAVIAVATDQLRLENNQCEHSWWTGDGAYTNPFGHDAHVTIKGCLQPTIVGNTMNSFPSFNRPVATLSGRYDNGSPTITMISNTSQVNIGDRVSSVPGLLPAGTITVISKTANSITLSANAIATDINTVIVTRLINPNGAAATLKIDGCNEALVANNDIAMGRLSHIEITSTSKNTRIGANRYYGSLTPTIIDNGIGTMGVIKTPTLVNSWVDYAVGREARFIKSIDGRVKLSGAVKSGTIGTAIMTLPVGFRPIGDRYFTCASVNTATSVWSFGVIGVTAAGVVTAVAGNTTFLSLDNVDFAAPLEA